MTSDDFETSCPVTVELHDGRRFTYASGTRAGDVIDDLRAKGVTPSLIKNTIHVIARRWRREEPNP